MKGFIKILEAILASIMILVALTFYLNVDVKRTNWDSTLLQVRAEDALASVANSGLLTSALYSNNESLVNNTLLDTNLEMLPATVEYSLQIKGIPNSIIYIGCNCTSSEIANLEARLSPLDFKYRGRNLSIRISQESISNIQAQTNILLFFNYKDLNPYSQNLESFLRNGGTIFMIGDLTQPQVQDGYMNSVFGLTWDGIVRNNVGSFYLRNENFTSFNIQKYYINLTNQLSTFAFTGSASIELEDGKTIIISGSGTSLLKTNEGMFDGNGRTAWMSDYPLSPETKNLTKAAVMWASGEKFVIGRTKTIPAQHVETKYVIHDFDTYTAILFVWRIFQ